MNLPERYLYHIWDARHFVPEMETLTHKQVKILFPGHFNTNAGPDYHHAVIEINGSIKRGDIEIHYKTSDWISHQHHEDPIYNNVILHVVYEHNMKQQNTFTEKGNIIDILELKDFLDHDLSKLIPPSEPIPDREPLCLFFAGLQPEQVRIILNHYGMERLQRRISRFKSELHFIDMDQLIYQSLMESMGYRQNQFPLLILAEQLPFRQLQKWKNTGMSKDEMTAIMLVSSGLFGIMKKTEQMKDWVSIYKKQSYFHHQIPCEWNLFRIRPAHHPFQRIQLFCDFLYSILDKKLLELIHNVFVNHRGKSARKIESTFKELLCSSIEPTQHGCKWGNTLIRLLIINALLPIETIHAYKSKNTDLIKQLERLYFTYPSLPENAHIRNMKHFMTISQASQLKGSALRQLGLQQLYRENCMIHNCESCAQLKIKLLSNL
jgi:hypothetical protein